MPAPSTIQSPPDGPAQRPRRRRLGGLLYLPMGAFTLLAFVAPLILLIVYSFGQIDVLTFDITFGWTVHNYTELFDSLYLGALLRSLALTVGATAGCLLIGFPAALALTQFRGRTRNLLLIGVIVPYWISFVVRNYAWLNLLGPRGWVTRTLEAVHLLGAGADLRYTWAAITIGMIYSYLPLMILPIFVALERIDPALLDAAGDLGLTRLATLRRVLVPLSGPGIIAGCLLVGIPATGEYTIPAVLGGEKTLMVGNIIANQFLSVGDFPFGAAIGSALLALMVLVLLISRRRLARLEDVL
jgi:ABC-type spermidine/putrescine transport system permease subunit I